MSKKKLVIAASLFVALILAVCLSAPPPSSAATQGHALRFRIVKHRPHFDVVKHGPRVVTVRKHDRFVRVHGERRYRVVGRSRIFVVLKSVRRAALAALSGVPVSVGKTSSASSGAASKANDNRTTTCWTASTRAYPQWWTVDLGTATTIYGVKSAWNSNRTAYRYRIETSLDGLTFTTAADRTTNRTTGAMTDSFRTSARYVRVQIVGTSPSGSAASANEITVNGEVGPPPDPTVTPTPTPTASPTVAPTPTPSVTPTPTPTASVAPTPTPTATPTVTPTATAYNVKDYGATGNGSTNDQPAIQTAINAASSAGGGTVYLPAGTYRLTTYTSITGQPGVPALPEASFSLQLRDGVTVQGASRASTVIVGDYSGSGMHPLGGDHNSNIGVKSLTIRCTKSATDGVKFLQCSNVTIDDVLADGQGVMYIGLALYSCHDSVIENSTAQNCYGYGFCSGEADVLGYTWATDNVTISNCNANNCGTNFRTRGTMTSVGSPYTLRKDAPVRNLRTTFSNCTSTKAINYGFLATDAGNETFTHCSHDGSGSQTYYHYAMQGVINAEMVECSDGGTLITTVNSAVSPWRSWWTSDGGYGACSSDYITANGVRAKASGT